MAFASTFDKDLAVRLRDPDSEYTVSSEILDGLKAFTEKIRPYVEDTIADDKVPDELSIERKLAFPPLMVDKELVLSMNEVFKRENKLANLMLAALKHGPEFENDIVKHRDAMYRAAVTAIITEKVSTTIEATGNTVPRLAGRLVRDSVRLFEHFFRVCQVPLVEELQILADAGAVSIEQADHWFQTKRQRMNPLYVARSTFREPVAKDYHQMSDEILGNDEPLEMRGRA